ncbi:MAG TPA: 23S rRNA pseudouridine synthase F, partial [Lachnospiraceae bacterium]|nr:23S rRNA pseudouridine synthase F [Lachnospiraceae bacterium]
RVYPVGRLDKDSEGLLLLTNQGELVNRIMRAGNFHEKEYEVTVDREVTQEFIKAMGAGVPVLDTVTRSCEVRATGSHTFRIVLTQGLNRQVRRMCEYFGYEVRKLKRVRIMNLTLDDLPVGKYREVSGKEMEELTKLLSGSSSLSWKERHG